MTHRTTMQLCEEKTNKDLAGEAFIGRRELKDLPDFLWVLGTTSCYVQPHIPHELPTYIMWSHSHRLTSISQSSGSQTKKNSLNKQRKNLWRQETTKWAMNRGNRHCSIYKWHPHILRIFIPLHCPYLAPIYCIASMQPDFEILVSSPRCKPRHLKWMVPNATILLVTDRRGDKERWSLPRSREGFRYGTIH